MQQHGSAFCCASIKAGWNHFPAFQLFRCSRLRQITMSERLDIMCCNDEHRLTTSELLLKCRKWVSIMSPDSSWRWRRPCVRPRPRSAHLGFAGPRRNTCVQLQILQRSANESCFPSVEESPLNAIVAGK